MLEVKAQRNMYPITPKPEKVIYPSLVEVIEFLTKVLPDDKAAIWLNQWIWDEGSNIKYYAPIDKLNSPFGRKMVYDEIEKMLKVKESV